MNWFNVLTTASGATASGSNFFVGYVSDHPNPVKEIVDSHVVVSYTSDFLAYVGTFEKLFLIYLVVGFALFLSLAFLFNIFSPLLRRLAQW